MTYGTKRIKSGKITGEITFQTGKRIFLNNIENNEFLSKIEYWKEIAIEKYKKEYAKSEEMGWGMK
jgi:hypothetical protein